MGFSEDELPTVGDWSRSAWSVRSGWGCCWVGLSTSEGECFWPVFDSLGSEKMTRLTKIPVSPYPSSWRLASRRHAAHRNRSRNCSFDYPHRRIPLRTVSEVSKLLKEGEVVVFNPLTEEMRALPPLLHPKNPVVVHILDDSAKRSYKVIVAGSSAASDEHSRSWRSSPPVSYLPPPDAELFKEYSVCGHGGLMCAEVSKLPTERELAVFNPLTGETRVLPPLLHPRNPVLVHISVDSANKSYKVIVAGSSAASDEHLSRKVEVFDSSTSKWKEVCDLPGPAFGLNEHQAGVCLNGKLFFISFLGSGGRGVVAFDVENATWMQDLTTPIPWSSYSNTVQLVESDGKLFVFSEQQRDQWVDHCIDELEFPNPTTGLLTCRWRNVVKVKKSGGRDLQVHPEHTCIGFGEENLGILRKKLLKILLASCIASCMPNGACAGDRSMDSRSGIWTSNAWGSPAFARKAAVTLLVGLTLIGARVALGIFRRRQTPGNRFDIMQGLKDSDIPTRRNPLFEILPEIPA